MSLNLMVTALATILMTLALQLRSTSSAGLLAIALINVMSFTDVLSLCIQAFTQLEISLGAIARIRNFSRTTISENKEIEDHTPSASWPNQGAITFSGLTASYNDTTPPALQSIDLTIMPGQKIGICGRTGSGKSTILATLLRLVEISSGTIIIDGLDISTIPREDLRARFAAIPQDAFILAGSVRTNADPTGESNDAAIITALEKVGLWTIIVARGGLEATLLDQPLSQGQQQLFCLARAILRGDRSKILILDEATSNVDRDVRKDIQSMRYNIDEIIQTDRIMQGIIRKEFQDHTILTVAHRLDTIMDR
jgi:ATP-binding cassette subfamily C (CFTR/MRP) protein 1